MDPGGTNLVTKCKLSEGYCVIPNKSAYLYGDTWEKVVKVVAPAIRKMRVMNVTCGLTILFSIYLTPHICPSKFFADDMQFPLMVEITHT